MLELNKIYCMDNVEGMKLLDGDCVDLTITSPPYDNLRNYKGFEWSFQEVVKQLYRITKDGGSVVWVVGDAVIDGSETGSSFEQALFFKSMGFKIHDTMIYEKNSSAFPASKNGNRYTNIFEYMFVFAKGKIKKPNLLIDKPNKWAGHTNWGQNTQYDKDGNLIPTGNIKPVPDFSARNNIWKYSVGFNDKTGHPAVFPERLAQDHILSWSNEQGLIFDPFMGSGTTAKMAKLNNRNFIGFEISQEYCDIAKKRLENIQ